MCSSDLVTPWCPLNAGKEHKCRRLVGAGPDDWWEFEETEIKGRSGQLEVEKGIWECGFGIERLWRRRFPGAPAKRGVCRFRVLTCSYISTR